MEPVNIVTAAERARAGEALTPAEIDHLSDAGWIEWIADSTAPEGGAWAWVGA